MLFWLPGVASVVLFFFLYEQLRRPAVVGVWCLTGLILPVVGGAFSPVWLVGLLLNVACAFYLSIQLRLL